MYKVFPCWKFDWFGLENEKSGGLVFMNISAQVKIYFANELCWTPNFYAMKIYLQTGKKIFNRRTTRKKLFCPASVLKITACRFSEAWWATQYLQSLWTLFALLAICGEPASQYWRGNVNKIKKKIKCNNKSCKKRIKCNNQVLQKENQEQKTKIKSSATTKSCKKNNGTKVHAIVGSWRPTLW